MSTSGLSRRKALLADCLLPLRAAMCGFQETRGQMNRGSPASSPAVIHWANFGEWALIISPCEGVPYNVGQGKDCGFPRGPFQNEYGSPLSAGNASYLICGRACVRARLTSKTQANELLAPVS